MTVEQLVERIQTLKVYRYKGQPALYQPITLLWAIGRAAAGKPRLVPWADTEQAVRLLLERHGVHGERGRPDYPVAAPYRAGLWDIPGQNEPVPPAHGDAELRRWFTEHQPSSGLVQPAHSLMARSGAARDVVVDAIIETFFGGGPHEDLLQDVGLMPDRQPDEGG